MDNYIKGETTFLDAKIDQLFPEASKDVVVMTVKPGSKNRNIIGFANKTLQAEETKDIVFSGAGPACSKVISCVEVLKRDFKGKLHQKTKIAFIRCEEFWEPSVEGLERLKVNRDIPSVHMLLAKNQLADSDESCSLTPSVPPGSSERRRGGGGGRGGRGAARGGRPRGAPKWKRGDDSEENKWKRNNNKKKRNNNSAGDKSGSQKNQPDDQQKDIEKNDERRKTLVVRS